MTRTKREIKEKSSRRAKLKKDTDFEVNGIIQKLQETKDYMNNRSKEIEYLDFKFKNKTQKDFYNKIINNRIVIGTGYAGTAKTFVSCAAAIEKLKHGVVDRIIITKPIVEAGAGDNIGFLKGSLDEKIGPYMVSYMDVFEKLISSIHLGKMIDEKVIEFIPSSYMRGRTFENCAIIVDESQNFNIKQLMLIVTRMGENCSMVFIGDVDQNDISKKFVALDFFRDLLNGIKDIDTHMFNKEDIVRDPILIEITDRYEKAKLDGKIPENQKGL